ncbi:MAG: LptE family protein [Proteobacteria bacterium]|nr:LptE family protein [Pseudomonadota bacterium]
MDPETPSVATISVPTWENRTSSRGIEAVFTEKLIEAITRRGLAQVVASADAEAILQGRILSISDSVASYHPTGAVDQFSPADYQVVVLVNITVTRKSDQKILWQLSNLQEETYYDARDRALMLDSNRRDALARAAEAIARQVVSRWGGGF